MDLIIEPSDKKTTDDYLQVQKRILGAFPVNIWNINIPGNMEVQMEVEFKKFLFAISERTNQDVTKKSVFDFYAQLDSLKEQHQKNKNGRIDNKIQ